MPSQQVILAALERSSKEIPSLSRDWESIPRDLQEEYVDSLQWVLGASQEILPQLEGSVKQNAEDSITVIKEFLG